MTRRPASHNCHAKKTHMFHFSAHQVVETKSISYMKGKSIGTSSANFHGQIPSFRSKQCRFAKATARGRGVDRPSFRIDRIFVNREGRACSIRNDPPTVAIPWKRGCENGMLKFIKKKHRLSARTQTTGRKGVPNTQYSSRWIARQVSSSFIFVERRRD